MLNRVFFLVRGCLLSRFTAEGQYSFSVLSFLEKTNHTFFLGQAKSFLNVPQLWLLCFIEDMGCRRNPAGFNYVLYILFLGNH